MGIICSVGGKIAGVEVTKPSRMTFRMKLGAEGGDRWQAATPAHPLGRRDAGRSHPHGWNELKPVFGNNLAVRSCSRDVLSHRDLWLASTSGAVLLKAAPSFPTQLGFARDASARATFCIPN